MIIKTDSIDTQKDLVKQLEDILSKESAQLMTAIDFWLPISSTEFDALNQGGADKDAEDRLRWWANVYNANPKIATISDNLTNDRRTELARAGLTPLIRLHGFSEIARKTGVAVENLVKFDREKHPKSWLVRQVATAMHMIAAGMDYQLAINHGHTKGTDENGALLRLIADNHRLSAKVDDLTIQLNNTSDRVRLLSNQAHGAMVKLRKMIDENQEEIARLRHRLHELEVEDARTKAPEWMMKWLRGGR